MAAAVAGGGDGADEVKRSYMEKKTFQNKEVTEKDSVAHRMELVQKKYNFWLDTLSL